MESPAPRHVPTPTPAPDHLLVVAKPGRNRFRILRGPTSLNKHFPGNRHVFNIMIWGFGVMSNHLSQKLKASLSNSISAKGFQS